MIQTWLFDASKLEEETVFATALMQVTAERQEEIGRRKNPAVRRLSLAAGLLLKEVFEQTGHTEQLAEIKKGEHGKPYLPFVPFYFNLSHSGEYASCAFGEMPLGVDLQMVKETVPKYTSRILSAEEAAFLQKLSAEEARILFYRLWARKESVIKWDGRGLRLPLAEISFIKKDIYNKEETLTNCIVFEGRKLYVREYTELLPRYVLCVCSETEEISAAWEEVSGKILKKPKR